MGMKTEKIGAAGKRRHMAGIGSKIKSMRNASRAAHAFAYRLAAGTPAALRLATRYEESTTGRIKK
jgi:hypothetical protein